MKKVKAYQVIEAYGPKFVQTVNQAIASGWQPIGGVSVPKTDWYAQAMVLYEEGK